MDSSLLASRSSLLSVVALIGGLALACAKPPPPSPAYEPDYSYNPVANEAGRGISIAIVSAGWGDVSLKNAAVAYSDFGMAPPADMAAEFAEDEETVAFRDAISRGLTEYLTGSSITLSGPFLSVDEMTFPEKKQADLVLTVTINTTVRIPKPSIEKSSSGTYLDIDASGPCVGGGSVDFVLWEPLSMQKMWAKSAKIDNVEVDCTVTSVSEYNQIIAKDAGPKVRELQFQSVMKSVERYFDPEEIALVKSQAQELRDRKVY